MTACRACGAPIIWVRTPPSKKNPHGSRLPLDPKPDPSGIVVIRDGTARVYGKSDLVPEGETAYVPHFATCPSWGRS